MVDLSSLLCTEIVGLSMKHGGFSIGIYVVVYQRVQEKLAVEHARYDCLVFDRHRWTSCLGG